MNHAFLMMKFGWIIFCLVYSSFLFGQASKQTADSAGQAPNVVLILIDDAALMDLGVYGGEAHTPNIDRLARRGTMMLNYHASPMCAPSRAMLMTGFDSHLTGVPNLPVFTPPDIAKQPGYEGVLNDKVWTLGTRLKRKGYRTYVTGKWHLGHSENTLPTKRGFDRSYILDASGADNYEHRAYLPTQESKPPWYKDGQLIDLPEDFYSSRNLVDEMVGFMEEEEETDQPFFAFLSFQAIHIPVQAPKRYTEKYIETYSKGWAAIRQQRFEKAKELGIIPQDVPLGNMLPVLKKWDALSEEEKEFHAKAMAVNAGMLEAMDEHIGRFVSYLQETNTYENTLFVITSDNGPEASSVGDVRSMQMWMDWVGYHRDYERLGEKGSYNFIGPEFASAAASPSAYFKFYAGEGGLRVPLIFSGPSVPEGRSSNAFSFITDVAPTILSLVGVSEPELAPAGPMTGRDLRPVIRGEKEKVYGSDEVIGIEAAGQRALFKGKMKLVKNGKPYGDGIWRLYDLENDPGETQDLSASSPAIFEELKKDYEAYSSSVGVIEMDDSYQPLKEIQNKFLGQIRDRVRPWFIGIALLLLGLTSWRRLRKRKNRSKIKPK